MVPRCIWSGAARPSASFSHANRACLDRPRRHRRCDCKRAKIAPRTSVLIRNTELQHRPKSQLNLEFQKKLARIQAAGVNGFVKGHRNALRSAMKPARPALKQ